MIWVLGNFEQYWTGEVEEDDRFEIWDQVTAIRNGWA